MHLEQFLCTHYHHSNKQWQGKLTTPMFHRSTDKILINHDSFKNILVPEHANLPYQPFDKLLVPEHASLPYQPFDKLLFLTN